MLWIKHLVLVLTLSAATAITAQQLILDGEPIDLAPGSQVVVDTNGNVVISSADGELTCVANTVPPVVNLLANGAAVTTINSGDNVTVTWSHQFGDTCSATGGTGTNWSTTNVQATSGTRVLTNVTSSTTLGLECTNLFGTTTDTASINIQGTTGGFAGFEPPADCPSTAPAPVNTDREDPLELFCNSTCRQLVANNFEGAFGSKWPGISNSKPEMFVGRNKYVAIGFNTGDRCTGSGCTRTNGFIEWESSVIGDGGKIVSISRCPGDFSQSLGNCRKFGSGPLRWGYNIASVCDLDPNAQYYLNMIHGLDTNPSTTTCNGVECGWLVQVR